jgi:FKBP-type peptidyl-prolyl cis-trans isomerase
MTSRLRFHFTLPLLAAGLAVTAGAQSPAPAGDLEAYEQLGAAAARSAGIADLAWTDAEFAAFVDGLRAAHEKRPPPLGDAGRRLLQEMQRRVAEVRAREKAEQDPKLQEFLRSAQASVGLQKMESGLLCRLIMPGAGPRPRPGDVVVANLNVKLPDGRTDVAALSAQDARLLVGEMPPGVNEALQMLALGGRAIFVLPPHLSFGTGQWPEGVPPGTPLLLQVELKDIVPAAGN